MRTIGLRELNQNPSRAVAAVRAGESLVVTDRGKPVLRMIPEGERPTSLARLLAAGQAQPPVEYGLPDVLDNLADTASIADLIVADRDRERRR